MPKIEIPEKIQGATGGSIATALLMFFIVEVSGRGQPTGEDFRRELLQTGQALRAELPLVREAVSGVSHELLSLTARINETEAVRYTMQTDITRVTQQMNAMMARLDSVIDEARSINRDLTQHLNQPHAVARPGH